MYIQIKHEYLRSRAYICLSLSSPFSSPPVTVIQIWPLSRYSCFYLGSLHPRNFLFKVCSWWKLCRTNFDVEHTVVLLKKVLLPILLNGVSLSKLLVWVSGERCRNFPRSMYWKVKSLMNQTNEGTNLVTFSSWLFTKIVKVGNTV